MRRRAFSRAACGDRGKQRLVLAGHCALQRCRRWCAVPLPFLLGLLVLISAAPGTEAVSVKIVNGSVVHNPLEKYSFFALPTASAHSDSWLGCGASIISPKYALTSAHCFGGGKFPCVGPTHLAVWVGDLALVDQKIVQKEGGKSFRTEAVLECHASFDGKCSHGHDIALLKLDKEVPSWVKPVPLDLQGSAKAATGELVTVIGFGLRQSSRDPTLIADVSSQLRMAQVQVLSQSADQCNRIYGGGWGCSDQFSEGPANNKHQQLCAGATSAPLRDTCAGDSGSPMIDASGVQVAVVSYGGGPGSKNQGPGRSCGDPNYPGVYARVSAFGSYIKSKVPGLDAGNSALEFSPSPALLRRGPA